MDIKHDVIKGELDFLWHLRLTTYFRGKHAMASVPFTSYPQKREIEKCLHDFESEVLSK